MNKESRTIIMGNLTEEVVEIIKLAQEDSRDLWWGGDWTVRECMDGKYYIQDEDYTTYRLEDGELKRHICLVYSGEGGTVEELIAMYREGLIEEEEDIEDLRYWAEQEGLEMKAYCKECEEIIESLDIDGRSIFAIDTFEKLYNAGIEVDREKLVETISLIDDIDFCFECFKIAIDGYIEYYDKDDENMIEFIEWVIRYYNQYE